MKKLMIAVLAVSATVSLAFALHANRPTSAEPSAGDAKDNEQLRKVRVKRGEYIVNTAGCHDCHTPWEDGPNGPVPDMTRMLSGHPQSLELPPAPKPEGPWMVAVAATNTAWAGPWGTSFTANLTPNRETGLGAWTETQFVQTIRTGRHLGSGRPVLPPMPIMVYQNFSDEDLRAIYWYLRSIPAIDNRVPQPLPPASL